MRSEVNMKGRCKIKLTVPNGRCSRITETLCAISAREVARSNANEKSSWSDRCRDRVEHINPRRRNNMKNQVTIANSLPKRTDVKAFLELSISDQGGNAANRKMHVEHAGQIIGLQAGKLSYGNYAMQ